MARVSLCLMESKMSLKAIIWAWDQKVDSAVTKLILLKLADNSNSETGVCNPKISTIAKHCNCHRRTVERNLQKLKEDGFIEIINQYKNNRKIKNSYILNLDTAESRIDTAESPIRYGRESQGKQPVSLTYKDLTPKNKKFSGDDLILAEFFYKKILEINPTQNKPNFEKWAGTIRLIRERDKKSHKDIQDLFIWANNDHFWSGVIISPSNLRKKWDRLTIQRGKNHASHQQSSQHNVASNAKLEESLRHDQCLIEQIEDAESVYQTLDAPQNPLPAP